MIKGIDVSSVQTNIDWNAVAASGVQFCIVKCGNGNSGIDPNYIKYIAGAQAAGLRVLAYHFLYPLPPQAGNPSRSPKVQAQMHFNATNGIRAAADLEWPVTANWAKWGCSAAQIKQWTLDYLDAYSQLDGRPMIIYTYPDFCKQINIADSPQFAQYPLWIASYESTPTIPAPWHSYVLWQTSGGTAAHLPNGEPVDTDLDIDLSIWDVNQTAPVQTSDPVQAPDPAQPPDPVQAPAIPGGNVWTSIGNSISQLFKRSK